MPSELLLEPGDKLWSLLASDRPELRAERCVLGVDKICSLSQEEIAKLCKRPDFDKFVVLLVGEEGQTWLKVRKMWQCEREQQVLDILAKLPPSVLEKHNQKITRWQDPKGSTWRN